MKAALELKQRHPEMRPWLDVVAVACGELGEPAWRAAAPAQIGEASADAACAPALQVSLQPEVLLPPLAPYCERLLHAARKGGLPAFDNRGAAISAQVAMASFQAALVGDSAGLAALATGSRIEPRAYTALANLLPVPFLHACREAWGDALARRRARSCCPCCGAWPLFVEVCGIERGRFARCGRCGFAWQAANLHCIYCGNRDHESLATLLVEAGEATGAIEICRRCRGYVKAFNTLTPSAGNEVMLRDLASVALDVAAMDRGYARPPGLGHEPS